MGLREFFRSLLDRGRKVKQIAAPMDISEQGDGNKNDLTSRAYYKSCLRYNRSEINRISKYVKEYTAKFKQVQKEASVDSPEYNKAKDEMYRWIVRLDEIKAQEKFFRPNTPEDIAYRDDIYMNFPDKLKEALSPNLDLRFHSTSISSTKQIMQSRKISSTPDRYDGYIKNSDGLGEISASNRDDIIRTIRYYSHLGDYTDALPAGCVFALFPKDKADAANHERNVIGSVDFRKDPEQLFGIFTTPENIEKVKGWMEKAKLNPNLVYTHEEFLEVVKIKSREEDKKAEFKQSIEVNKEATVDWMNNTGPLIVPDPDLYQENNEKEVDDEQTL